MRMREDEMSLGDVQRGQQQLREHIAENDRLIGETTHRVERSRAITGAQDSEPGDEASVS